MYKKANKYGVKLIKISEELKNKLSKVELVITDVDGVLTDGGLYYTEDGLYLKKFNVKDGMGVHILREAGIKCGIISTDVSGIMKKRGERLKMDFVHVGVWDKDKTMFELCKEYAIDPRHVAFIGDDVNDLGIIEKAGVTASPADAVDIVREKVDFVLSKKGGDAVFREFADLIISCKS